MSGLHYKQQKSQATSDSLVQELCSSKQTRALMHCFSTILNTSEPNVAFESVSKILFLSSSEERNKYRW